jgi:hypothetical protein
MKAISEGNGFFQRLAVTLTRAIIVAGCFFWAASTFAQTLSVQSDATQPTQPDSIVQLTADAQGLPLLSPDAVPASGTFWLVMPGINGGVTAPMPCPPKDTSLPIYQIANGQFLVDATGGQVAVSPGFAGRRIAATTVADALEQEASSVVNLITRIQTSEADQQTRATMQAMGMDVPSPGDGGTNSFTPDGASYTAPVYGTNLWIAGWNVVSGNVTGTASNTLADVWYEILTNTDLTTPNWGSSGLFVLGSETTNWTQLPAMSVNLMNNCFFRLRSWIDSANIGIPDWWQLLYFGYVGIDPNAPDPAGDGYTNLQKYQMGLNPNIFTPPAISTFAAVLSTNGTNVILSWSPAFGKVQNYALGRYTFDWNTYQYDFTSVGPASGNTNSFVDVGAITNGNPNATYYQIQADYTNGSTPVTYAYWIQSSAPAPSGVTVNYNANNNTATVNWQPSPGNVTGYTILRQNSTGAGFSPIATVPTTPTSFVDNSYPGGFDVEYEVEADYAQGNSSPSDPANPRTNPAYTVPASIVRGPQGALYLVVAGIPQNVTTFRVYRTDSQASYYPISSFSDWWGGLYSTYTWATPQLFSSGAANGYFDVPATNFINGIYQLTTAQAPPFGTYSFQVQALASDGLSGAKVSTGYATGDQSRADYNVPFYDGRAQIAQNINFLFRESETNTPFSMGAVGWPFYEYSYSAHSNYVFAGFHYCNNNNGSPLVLSEFQPFEENNYYKNFCFASANVDSGGNLDTGVGCPAGYWAGSWIFPYFTVTENPPTTYFFDSYGYVSGASQPSFSPVLDNTTAQWLVLGGGVLSYYGTNYFIPNQNNCFGLPLVSIKWPGTATPPQFPTMSPGNYGANVSGSWFFQMGLPTLVSNSYYFARHNIDPLPGEPNFTVTNTTPVLFTSVGQPFTITAWAKQSLQNGNSGTFAYAEQYFDKAYLADQNGNVTTNQTGILSEYGEFFPTAPGKVFLKTKADGALGTVGQCAVNVIGLVLDKNHDGKMDGSFNGQDATSQASPMVWWINDDYDYSGASWDLGHDVQPSWYYNDGYQQKIDSQRDLEDYARLWICGMPALTNGNYQVTLSWANVSSGNPTINLFDTVETNGGIGYLTNLDTATAEAYNYSVWGECRRAIATISPSQSFTFPASHFTNTGNKYFLFDGAIATGAGELLLTVTDNNNNTIAQTGAWLDLHEVRDFYERATITNNISSSAISNWTSGIEMVQQATASALGSDTNLIVLVHGFNVGYDDWLLEGDTVFKRLYWAGYRGKFMAIKWPCEPVTLWTGISENTSIFNNSEIKSYKAGTALKNYLSQLRSRFPNYQLNVLAHSQGNAIMGEAIEQGAPFDTYILTQGAMPASSYDVNAATYSVLTAAEALVPTPEWQPMGYHGVYTNMTGNIVSYFNPQDSVLNIWNADQAAGKPNGYANHVITPLAPYYSYDGANGWWNGILGGLFSSYQVTDPQESRAMISRSRTQPVGRQDTSGVINQTIDLHAQFGFTTGTSEHSAEWTRPIQTCLPYYVQILNTIKP